MALIIRKLDFPFICRTCLQIKSDMVIINSEIQNMLMTCIGVKIGDNHTLPNHLCEECVSQIHKSFEFKRQCLESDNILQNVFDADSHLVQNEEQVNIYAIKEEVDLSTEDKSVNISREQEEQLFDSKEGILASERTVNSSAKQLDNNLKTCEDGELYVSCTVCMKTMKRITLRCHMRRHGIAKRFKCDLCDKLFFALYELARHRQKAHSITDSFQCVICKKMFLMQEQLDKHKIRHVKDEKSCDVCGRTFRRNADLERHKKIHLRPTSPVTCSLCGAQFTCKKNYNIHRQLVHLANPIDKQTCSICGKRVYDVDLHTKRLHSSERPFQCELCSKVFTFQMDLYKHIKRVHEHEKKYGVLCNICGKISDCPSDLKVHMLSHTDVSTFQCHVCDKKYKYPSSLRDHVRKHTHKYHCEFCDKNFSSSQSYKCHLRLHTGERPYACKLCDKAYTKKSALSKHMEFHG